MININLLPWREAQRGEYKKQFFIAIASAALISILILAIWHWFISSEISNQLERNQFLTQAIQGMDQEIQTLKKVNVEKQQILQNLSLIQDLHNSKFEVVGVLDEIVRLVPQHVYMSKIERSSNKITLSGYATSNETITQLMRNISQAQWISNPALDEIHSDDLQTVEKEFTLTALVRSANLDANAVVKE